MSTISEKLEVIGTKVKALRKSSPNPDAKVDMMAIKAFDVLTDSMKGIDTLLVTGSEEQVEIYEKLLKATVDLASNTESNPEDYQKKMLEVVKEISALPNQKNQELSNKIRDVAKKQAAMNFTPSAKSRDIVGTALGVAALPFFNPVAIAALSTGLDKIVDAVNARRLMKTKTMNEVEKAQESGEIQKYLREADLVREDDEDQLPLQTNGQPATQKKKRPLRPTNNQAPIPEEPKVPSNTVPGNNEQVQPQLVPNTPKKESEQLDIQPSNPAQSPGMLEREQREEKTQEPKVPSNTVKQNRTKLVKIDKMEIGNLIIKKMTFPKTTGIGNILDPKKKTPFQPRKTSILDRVKTSLFGEQKTSTGIVPKMGTIAATLGVNNLGDENDKEPSGSSGILDTLGIAGAGAAAASVLKKGVSGVKNLVGKAKPFAIPAAIAYAAFNAVDYGAGKLGVGKNEDGTDIKVDEGTDDANWKRMGTGQKVLSGVARGIEKVGSFVGLDNFAREAQAERIRSETIELEKDLKPVTIENPDKVVKPVDSLVENKKPSIVSKKSNDVMMYDEMGNAIGTSSSQVDVTPSVQKMVEQSSERVNSLKQNIDENKMYKEDSNPPPMQPIINNVTNNTTQGGSRDERPVAPASSRTSESSFKRYADNSSFY